MMVSGLSLAPSGSDTASTDAAFRRIGFIGLGRMGLPMCRNLLRAGFVLEVLDTVPAKLDVLVAEGALAASSPFDAGAGSSTSWSGLERTRGRTSTDIAITAPRTVAQLRDSAAASDVILSPEELAQFP